MKGLVVDSLDQPVSFALILIKAKDAPTVLNTCSSDLNGQFSMSISRPGTYIIQASRLGFRDTKKTLTISNESEISLRLKMLTQAVELDEFVISSTPFEFKKRGDTISINADAYTDERVVVIQDLLRRIPGIEVSDQGDVSVQGQSVETVMIDGDNLFEKGYQVMTKNLRSEYIDQVQVLNNYSENEILKGIEANDKVALNLTLKKGKRLPLTGDVEVGTSYNTKRYEAELNLLSIKKGMKHFGFSSASNIGNDPTGPISNLLYSNRTLPGDDLAATALVNLVGPQAPLAEKRVNLNNPKFLSLNSIFKPHKKIKIRTLLFGKKDRVLFDNATRRTFSHISFTDRYQAKLQDQTINGRINVDYAISKTTKFELEAKHLLGKSTTHAQRITNEQPLSEQLQGERSLTDIHFVFSRRVKDNQVLQLTGRHLSDSRPQIFQAKNILESPARLLLNNGDSLSQNTSHALNFNGLDLHYIKNKNRFNHSLRAGASLLLDDFNSNLTFMDTSGRAKGIINTQERISENYYVRYRTRYQAEKLAFTFAAVVRNAQYQLGSKLEAQYQKIINLRPSFEVEFTPKEDHQFELLYSFSNQDTEVQKFAFNYALNSTNTFSKSAEQLPFQLAGHTLMGRYAFGSWGTKTQGSLNILSNWQPMYFGNHFFINSNYVFVDNILLQNKILHSFRGQLEHYFSNLKLNAKGVLGYEYDQFQNSINDGARNDITRTNFLYGIELRSAFKHLFNFHLGLNHSNGSINNGGQQQFINDLYFCDLYFEITPKLQVEIKNELYQNAQTAGNRINHYFMDISLRYRPTNTKFNFSIVGNNLLNTKQYNNFMATDFYQVARSVALFERYIMLKIGMRI